MYGVMYLNTYEFEFMYNFSEMRLYYDIIINVVMADCMLCFMLQMRFKN